MTDTELILSRLDSMHQDMKKMQADISEIRGEVADLREEMYSEIGKVRGEIAGLREELTGKIEAVRLAVVRVRDRMDTLEFVLQTEISRTYDLAQENAGKIGRLMCYNGKIVPMPVS